MKKVSIIVPVYNVEQYLHKCLTSLVSQTLDDYEVIVVNDGSKDQSQKIIEDFQKQYPDKIKSYIKENGGLSDARNYGIDRATGKYIGFVDSDDYVTKTMFEDMYALAEKHQAEIVICNLQKVDEEEKVLQKLTQLPNKPEKIILKEDLSVFSDISYFACNKIFKKELFNGKRFKKGIHFEDIQLIPQLLLDSNVISQTQNYHYQYFERQESISKTHTLKGLDILKAVEDVSEFFSKSKFAKEAKALQDFQVLEGVYTFLAYLAFVKDESHYRIMSAELKKFIFRNNINTYKILMYKRFGKNYLLSLPVKKKIYYLFYLSGLENLIRKLI